jgi:hypothetical protein
MSKNFGAGRSENPSCTFYPGIWDKDVSKRNAKYNLSLISLYKGRCQYPRGVIRLKMDSRFRGNDI